MKTLDLTREKIRFFPVELDEIGLINVKTPTKAIYQELIAFAPSLARLETIDTTKPIEEVTADTESVISGLYGVIAEIMSNNKEEKYIDPETLERILPVDFGILFLTEYSNFMSDVQQNREKN